MTLNIPRVRTRQDLRDFPAGNESFDLKPVSRCEAYHFIKAIYQQFDSPHLGKADKGSKACLAKVTPHYSFRFKPFTAVDVASRYLVGKLYARAIQVNGGSECCAEFEAACQQRQLPLIVLPPYSPKLNTRVEYVHGTC